MDKRDFMYTNCRLTGFTQLWSEVWDEHGGIVGVVKLWSSRYDSLLAAESNSVVCMRIPSCKILEVLYA